MARALSDTQKKSIFTSIPASITGISASKIWSNQAITSYPTITLNISNDGIASYVFDVSSGQLYYQSTLTIHILTTNQSGQNGATIAESFASLVCSTVEGWTTPLTGDVRIFNAQEDIASIGNLGYDEGVFDYIVSITLYHS
ncbi:hypothetical protein [Methanolobus psychrotolerans]|uniref:hypothetical protein n=1 Tax=Methanolobus psychrotolerans TaxID=1874706 RepID=UPI000B9177EF|nr:hypothetical protein [Methanolobus psychrotolerans]